MMSERPQFGIGSDNIGDLHRNEACSVCGAYAVGRIFERNAGCRIMTQACGGMKVNILRRLTGCDVIAAYSVFEKRTEARSFKMKVRLCCLSAGGDNVGDILFEQMFCHRARTGFDRDAI